MNRTFKPNRQGITLLFVISMIVLFLLMGTAFIIVATNFNRDSKNRISSNLPEGKGSVQSNQLIDRMIFRIIHGPDLHDIDSPLRANDLLSDQYGYGVKSFVGSDFVRMFGDEAFVEIALSSDPTVTPSDDLGFNLLSEMPGRLGVTFKGVPLNLNNSYGGRVLSFTTGPAKGFSARIYRDYYTPSGVHVFRIPAASVSGDLITTAMISSLPGSEVIINGRDFGGTGADVRLDANLNPTNLGPQALLPNRIGQSYSGLLGSYLTATRSDGTFDAWNASVNEPWDAADISNMFLSGFDKFGNPIASFHRKALLTNGPPSTLLSGRTFFHAFDEGGDGMPDVDTDGDLTPDAYWMETGESIVTNRDGKRFKPLFAIQIKDMDGRLSVNAHGNRTHLRTDGFVATEQLWIDAEPNLPLGSGVGTADINLSRAVGAALPNLLNARYSGDTNPATVDQLPGDGTTSFRSRAKLFGHPNAEINPNGTATTEAAFGTIGGLYGTAMDIHGRFRYGTPASSNASITAADSGFDDFRDLNFQLTFNNSLPQINMLFSRDIDTFTDEFSGNPYEMSLSGKTAWDSPFTPEELERVLRPNDIDSQVLPDRLSNILSSIPSGARRGLFTTDSYDVPMLYRDFVEELLRNIPQRNTSLSSNDIGTLIPILTNIDGQFAFAPELFRGLKMDINRPFGDGIDNNRNQVVDEPGEEAAANNEDALDVLDVLRDTGETAMDLNYGSLRPNSGAADANPRVIFARHMYMLAMLLLEPVDLDQSGAVDANERLEFAKAMAQWAVNVVDFRDPDSIHTQFAYDPSPFDAQGWNPPTDPPVDGVSHPTFFVWGAERPELLLTETLAVHIQNMKNTETDPAEPPTYEQQLRPESFAYFEVYNPWTQNRLNQQIDRSLYTRFGVDLGRKAPDDSPVWRFEVERAEAPAVAGNPTVYKPLRYVYMTNPAGSPVTYANANENQVPGDIEIFSNSSGSVLLRPGRQALIGTQGFADGGKFQVFMGRKTLADDSTGDADDLLLDETTRLAITPGNVINPGTVERYTGSDLDSTRRAMIMFIDQSVPATGGTAGDRKFSLSDPFGGYLETETSRGLTGTDIDDGFLYDSPTTTLDNAHDSYRTANELASIIRIQDGISKNFRYVRLQRLANPLIPWDANTNPYLTIDSMEVDLVSINGADADDPSLPAPAQTQAVSLERGNTVDANAARAQLWGFQRETAIRPATGNASTDHHYALAFTESLGRTNDLFAPSIAGGSPFPWLTWNNRPFVSHMEIMNVPYLAPDRLTYAPEVAADSSPYPTQPFTIDDASTITDPFVEARPSTLPGQVTLAGRYGHLLNFFASEDGATNQFSDAYKLLDFIEVPSRFVGNESYYLADGVNGVFKHPFNTISRYRVPGKVNINTIPPTGPTRSVVWEAMIADGVVGGEQVHWGTVKNSLYGAYVAEATGPTDFENPFRPAEAANLLPGQPAVIPPSTCTLMRPANSTSSPLAPLFDYQSALNSDNTNRSAALRNGIRTRLGNLVTTKSSVFACWITVGYFEVDQDDNLIDINGAPLTNDPTMEATPAAGTVAEIGAETGEQVRTRGFFIFDRSIPVAFEPGKNHNVEKAILVKSP